MTKGSLETRTQEVRFLSLLFSPPRPLHRARKRILRLPAIYEIGEVDLGKCNSGRELIEYHPTGPGG